MFSIDIRGQISLIYIGAWSRKKAIKICPKLPNQPSLAIFNSLFLSLLTHSLAPLFSLSLSYSTVAVKIRIGKTKDNTSITRNPII